MFQGGQGTNHAGSGALFRKACKVPASQFGLACLPDVNNQTPSLTYAFLILSPTPTLPRNVSPHYNLALSITSTTQIIVKVPLSTFTNMAAATSKTATPKAKTASAGVKKAGRPPGKAGKRNNARNAMIKMQAYCEFEILTRHLRVIRRVLR